MLTISAAAAGCGSSPITKPRIESALAATFANLVHLQARTLGLPPMAPSTFVAAAACQKVTGGAAGAGDWMCTIDWQGPDHQPLRDAYDLVVTTDGCYTAQVEGGTLGGPLLTRPDGRAVKNLLYAFDGCFALL